MGGIVGAKGLTKILEGIQTKTMLINQAMSRLQDTGVADAYYRAYNLVSELPLYTLAVNDINLGTSFLGIAGLTVAVSYMLAKAAFIK